MLNDRPPMDWGLILPFQQYKPLYNGANVGPLLFTAGQLLQTMRDIGMHSIPGSRRWGWAADGGVTGCVVGEIGCVSGREGIGPAAIMHTRSYP